jgi:hypothetical protein
MQTKRTQFGVDGQTASLIFHLYGNPPAREVYVFAGDNKRENIKRDEIERKTATVLASFHDVVIRTTQWPKEKVQKAKQRSTKRTHKTKDRVTRTPLKTGGELKCFGRVGSSCSTSSGTRRVNLVTNPVTSHHREKTGKYLRQVEHIRGRPLCCLFFFDIRIRITLLVSSNSSLSKKGLKMH